MDWLSFLKIMAMEEHAARAKYQLAMDLTDDKELKTFFQRLRDEEEFHGVPLVVPLLAFLRAFFVVPRVVPDNTHIVRRPGRRQGQRSRCR